MPDPNVVPSTPSPMLRSVVLAVIRIVLLGAGAAGFAVPASLSNQDTLVQIAGAVAFLIGTAMQVWAEYQNAASRHAAAIQSARAGKPVRLA